MIDINKPKVVVERWVNIYQHHNEICLHVFDSKDDAELEPYNQVLARAVPFKWTEGDQV
jgi:hypothetical protein